MGKGSGDFHPHRFLNSSTLWLSNFLLHPRYLFYSHFLSLDLLVVYYSHYLSLYSSLALDFKKLCHPHSIMAPATATSQKSNNAKGKHDLSRTSSTSKPEAESPTAEANEAEPAYLKELQKSVVTNAFVVSCQIANAMRL